MHILQQFARGSVISVPPPAAVPCGHFTSFAATMANTRAPAAADGRPRLAARYAADVTNVWSVLTPLANKHNAGARHGGARLDAGAVKLTHGWASGQARNRPPPQ